jgi:hypothetical protein
MTRSLLMIGAIHNGELASAPAQEIIVDLAEVTEWTSDFHDQEPLNPHPEVDVLRSWRRTQQALEREWTQYLGSARSALLGILGRLKFNLALALSAHQRMNLWRTREIEQRVTAKHVAVWRHFARTVDPDSQTEGSNFELLVMESDAVLTESTNRTIRLLLEHPTHVPRYVNLSGGLDIATLGIAGVARKPSLIAESLVTYARPITNTSCAYMINRAMADVFLGHIRRFPEDEELGIDWLINAIFLAAAGREMECVHAIPPAILHGSRVGLTRSWHPHR